MQKPTASPASADVPADVPKRKHASSTLFRILKVAGPGIVTGAADDDPSGIATYSVAGAQLGTSMLWTSLLTWPLMAVVQVACAQIGSVSGAGLGRALRQKFPLWLLAISCAGLLVANSINIGADLSGMADAAVDLFGVSYFVFALLFAVAIGVAIVVVPYARFASVLKWLVLSLGAYALTAFVTHPDWRQVWHDLLIPHWPRGKDEWSTLVALLGTTISPYLFFWQSSSEVEEEKCHGRTRLPQRFGATRQELSDRRLDVWTGTFFSNLVMFFVILSCAMTLHRKGIMNIETSRQAADALRPIAGNFASALYTAGIIGVGLLAIPTLAGSSAYAFAETYKWRQGLNEHFKGARSFYGMILGSIAAGTVFALCRVNPVKALYWTAILNGILSPIALVGVLAVIRDRKIMKGQTCSKLITGIVALTAIAMAAAAVIMFIV